MLRCVERRCQRQLASKLNGKETETKFRYFSHRRRFVSSELRALRATEAEADIDVERKGHCWKAGSSLVDWPAHCADTRAQRNNIHRVIPDSLLSTHDSGKIRANTWLKASPKKIMLIPAWPARHSKWSQNSKEDRNDRGHRSTSACASFLGAEVEAWNFVMASHPGKKKSVIMTSFFNS